ncbi:MAG: hypothetical protein IT377_13285 [Polyangiaceae bacterium]|nr:hypothetical protein [Polyangiaceae bacterium]
MVLSTLAREKTAAQERLSVTVANHKELARTASAPRGYSETIDRVLLAFAEACRYPGSATPPLEIEPLSARFCLPAPAFKNLVHLLKTDGLLNVTSEDPVSVGVGLTSKGWERVDRLQSSRSRSRQAFVAMWFDRGMQDAFENGIRPALEECGFSRPFRVDDAEHRSRADFEPRIDDRIMAGIRRASLLVVDVTGSRCPVYFEAGFGLGLGIPIVWTCRRGNEPDMCFDTRQYEHILWDAPEDLKENLVQKIRAHGWDFPGGGRP